MKDRIIYENESNLVHVITPSMRKKEDISIFLKSHPEIKFVSLVSVDLRGNDTDEKIPITSFTKNTDELSSFEN